MSSRLAAEVAATPARAVLLDWDGTLADSGRVNSAAMAAVVAPFGVALEWDWFASRTGTSAGEMLRLLLGEGLPDDEVAALSTARDQAFLERADQVEPFADTLEALGECRRRGVQAAVASGGSRPVIEHLLERWGIEVDTVVARVDVARGKPAPDVFVLAAHRLGVDPADCLVLEDADEGLEAARRAGMPAIDVRTVRAEAPG